MLLALCLNVAMAGHGRLSPGTPWMGFGNDSQHTAQSNVASLQLDSILWRTPIDQNPPYSGSELLAHYGSPVVTDQNTVIIPLKTGLTDGFKVQARDGETKAVLWQTVTTYSVPPHDWYPTFNVTLLPPATDGGPLRVAWPESGGRIGIRSSAEAGPATKKIVAFYGNDVYTADKTNYDNNVKICTPLTAGSDGSIYFGYQVLGSTSAALSSGFAKIDADGNGHYVSAATLSGDSGINQIKQNCAPALSNDGNSVYIVTYSGNFGVGRLVQASTTTLFPTNSVALLDPKTGNNATVDGDGTASPMVGPDGDVYTGVLENPFGSNHWRGWLLHYSADLQTTKTAGAFGWDNTPSVVPASIVPFYHGTSSYLLFCKYNNYAGAGDGVNHVAIVDPNAGATDPVSGITTMRVVGQKAGKSPDVNARNGGYPDAVREWCVSSAVVDVPGKCILANSEDGYLYRWNLVTNDIKERIKLTRGIGQAYTCTLIGPSGHVLAVNNGQVFTVGTLAR